jgi:GxxExxY protein
MTRELPDDRPATHRLAERELTGTIIECFYRVYEGLGFGFLEAVYRNALAVELRERSVEVLVETVVEVSYKGCRVGWYRIDLLVEH